MLFRKLLATGWLPLLLGGLATPCQAIDFHSLRINGFISQGYINSAGNNFLADSLAGTTEFYEAGITFNARVSDRLRVGFQLLSRDLGEEGDGRVVLDWGMGDYHFRDWLGVRLGKIQLPLGLYNQGRDSDVLRPMVFLPQSIYDENKRNLLVSAAGGGLYGNLPVGGLGDLDYQLYYGEVSFPEDSGHARGNLLISQRLAQSKGLGSVTDIDFNNRYVYGGALVLNTPIRGLRLGASFFEGKTDFALTLDRYVDPETGQTIVAPSTGEGEGHNDDFMIFSLEYSRPSLLLAAEYSEFANRREILGVQVPGGTSQAWYVQFSYRLGDRLTFSVLYDEYWADKDDRGGKTFVRQNQPAFLGWRKDLGVGLRFDVSDNWLLKAEWHTVDGAGLGLPVYNPQGVEEEWSYYVLKTYFFF